MTEPGNGAVLSDDGVYRYALTRRWGQGKALLWIMLNPSTADADNDDATIRRVIGFSKAWGYPGADVVNLFALRSRDPRELWSHPDPIGPDNDRVIWTAALRAPRIVCAWGAHGRRNVGHASNVGRDDAVLAILRRALAKGAWCLGRTKSGAPVHPLRLRASTQLELYWTPHRDGKPDGDHDVVAVNFRTRQRV